MLSFSSMPYKDPKKAADCKKRYYERNKELCIARAQIHNLEPRKVDESKCNDYTM